MTNKIREEFEAWAVSDGYEIEKSDDKRFTYSCHETECAWNGWKASRAALCVKLPMEYKDQFNELSYSAPAVIKAILDAGVRYK